MAQSGPKELPMCTFHNQVYTPSVQWDLNGKVKYSTLRFERGYAPPLSCANVSGSGGATPGVVVEGGCEGTYAPHGCCPDGTPAAGFNEDGSMACGYRQCEGTQYGCCLDGRAATEPDDPCKHFALNAPFNGLDAVTGGPTGGSSLSSSGAGNLTNQPFSSYLDPLNPIFNVLP